MAVTRKIIEIDEELCDGCGQCILACAEGALELVDGKAKLVGELYCDGLGACLGDCPLGALTIVERPAQEFDEEAVEERLRQLGKKPPAQQPAPHAGGCPSAAQVTLPQAGGSAGVAVPSGPAASGLGHFPVKLQLLGPQAPFLQGSDLVLLADCVAAAYPDLHQKLLPGRAVVMGCPKLDDLEAHISRLAAILEGARPRRLTVAHMEVPCCRGFLFAAQEAAKRAGVALPLARIEVSRDGRVIAEEDLNPGKAA